MDNIYEIIGKLLAAFFVALVAYLTPKAKAWLEANAGKATQEKLEKLVTAFARAAEQLFHDADPTGEKRNQFVRQQLEAMGIEITSAVINMIESAVWEINTETKKAQVQDKAMTNTRSIVTIGKDCIEGIVDPCCPAGPNGPMGGPCPHCGATDDWCKWDSATDTCTCKKCGWSSGKGVINENG